MKKIPGVAKPPGIFLPTAPMWNCVDKPLRLEARAIYATTLRTTDLVDQ
jgi:hypothetical protein